MQILNPYFLITLLAIAIPIVIHLFNFRKFKKVIFTNVSILKQIQITTKKQNRVKNIILLISRILTIICLVFLFAQPYLSDNSKRFVSKGQNSVIVFVDNSFSMQNKGSKANLLEEAKDKAKDVVSQYNTNDLFALLTMDMEGRHQQFVNKDKFLELLNEVEISTKSEQNSKILKKAYNLLGTKNGTNKSFFFISDFQKSAFDAPNFISDTNIKSLLVPLQANNVNNIYIDSISFDEPSFRMGQNVAIKVRVVNKSENKAEKVSVKLFIDNKQLSISSIDIEANQSHDVIMNFTLEKHGIQHGYLSIIDNPVTYDDNFYFTIQTKPAVDILSINGTSANEYISRLFSNNEEVKLSNMSEKSIDFTLLNNYSLIILNGVIDFSSGLLSEIKRFRERGGSLVIIPSERMNLSSYQMSMTALKMPYFSSFVSLSSKVSEVNQHNKLYKDVFSTNVDNMEMPSLKSYYRLNSSTKTSKETIMKMQNGDDFLILSTSGNSKAYVFCTPLLSDFTDFVNQSLFVPTLWNMALLSRNLSRPFYFIDDVNGIDISSFIDISKINVLEINSLDNKYSIIPQIRKDKNRAFIFLHNQLNLAGNYNLVQDKTILGGLSFNYNRDESDLSFLEIKEIKKLLKDNKLKDIEILDTKQRMISSHLSKAEDNSIFILLFIILILCIITEMFIMYKNKIR